MAAEMNFQKAIVGVPAVAQQDQQHLRSAGMQVRSLAQHSGLRKWGCVAVAQIATTAQIRSDPWPGNSICHKAAKKKAIAGVPWWLSKVQILVLSLLWVKSLLWHGLDPWPRELPHATGAAKNK